MSMPKYWWKQRLVEAVEAMPEDIVLEAVDFPDKRLRGDLTHDSEPGGHVIIRLFCPKSPGLPLFCDEPLIPLSWWNTLQRRGS